MGATPAWMTDPAIQAKYSNNAAPTPATNPMPLTANAPVPTSIDSSQLSAQGNSRPLNVPQPSMPNKNLPAWMADPEIQAKYTQSASATANPPVSPLPPQSSTSSKAPASVLDYGLAGIETGLKGLEGAALQGGYGAATTQGSALHRGSEAINYAFNPEHTFIAAMQPDKDFSNPTGIQQGVNIGGQLLGGIGHSLIDPIGGIGGMLKSGSSFLDLLGNKALATLATVGDAAINPVQAASAVGNAVKSGVGAVAKQVPMATAGAAGGLGSGIVANSILDKYLPADTDPQTKADLMNITGAGAGLLGGGLSAGLAEKVLPTTAKTGIAQQYEATLGTPEGQDLLSGSGGTPVATKPGSTMEQQEGANTNALTNARTAIQNTVSNAQQMAKNRYNNTGETIGENLITLNPSKIAANQKLGNLSQGELKSGLDDVIAEIPTFSKNIKWVRDNFLDPVMDSGQEGVAPQLTYQNLQKTLGILNDVVGSQNIKHLSPDIKNQLNGYRSILKDAINSHLTYGENGKQVQYDSEGNILPLKEAPNLMTQTGEPVSYKEGSGQIYKDADFLYSKLQNALQTNKTLNPELSPTASAANALKLGTLDALATGEPQAHLENVTRAMHDINQTTGHLFPTDNDAIQNNIQNLNSIHNAANDMAASKGGKNLLDLNLGLVNQRALLNEPGNNRNVQTSPLIDNQAMNSTIKNHIANMFGQGASEGNYTPNDMKKAINNMSGMLDSVENSQTALGLDTHTMDTLRAAKSMQNIIQTAEHNPNYASQLQDLTSTYNDKSPNAALQAARILTNLEKTQQNVNTQRALLEQKGILQSPAAKIALNGHVLGKVWDMFKGLAGYGKDTQSALETLRNIQRNMTSTQGRTELQNQYQNSAQRLNEVAKNRRQGIISGATAGATLGKEQQ